MKPIESCQIHDLEHILYGIFGHKDDGYFVEVGAYDGRMWSNTYHLAEAGWSGLCIEPIPILYDCCKGNHKAHPKIDVVNCAVGMHGQDSVMFYTDGASLFTSKEWLAQALGECKQYGEIKISTLDSILREHEVPICFDLLVVDVEGAETDVLRGFDIGFHSPKMVIIEVHERHENAGLWRNIQFVNSYMIGSGYTRIYCDQWNNIYIRW